MVSKAVRKEKAEHDARVELRQCIVDRLASATACGGLIAVLVWQGV